MKYQVTLQWPDDTVFDTYLSRIPQVGEGFCWEGHPDEKWNDAYYIIEQVDMTLRADGREKFHVYVSDQAAP